MSSGADGVLFTEFLPGCRCSDCEEDEISGINMLYEVCGCPHYSEDDDVDTWRQFAILTYSEGRKYTVGDKFTSKEEQGEFIFLKTKQFNLNFASLLEIYCDAGKFWVKPVQGNLIKVNGSLLDHGARTRLNFEDELDFPMACDVRGGTGVFCFRERELSDPEGAELTKGKKKKGKKSAKKNKNVEFTPGQNHMILFNIFSHLPIKSLKCARLVCQEWNVVGSRVIREKAKINFGHTYIEEDQVPLVRNRDDDEYDSEDDFIRTLFPPPKTLDFNASLKFSQYCDEMKTGSPWSNWSLVLPKFHDEEESTGFSKAQGQPGGKYIVDLNWFLDPDQFHKVKRLSLSGHIKSDADYQIHLGVIRKLQETLEELELRSEFCLLKNEETERVYTFDGNLDLKKLKVFKFRVSSSGYDRTMAWLEPWVGAIRRVETIYSGCAMSIGQKFMEYLDKFGTQFQNLTRIELNEYIKPTAFSFLQQLRAQQIRKLILCNIAKGNFAGLEPILAKHNESLRYLELRISALELPQGRGILHLPRFPNLEHFKLETCPCEDCISALITVAFPPLLPGDVDGTGVNYAVHLPSIRSLEVLPNCHKETFCFAKDIWKFNATFFDAFLPKRDELPGDDEEQQCCKTLTRLEIPYQMRNLETKENIPYPRLSELPAMFPNVENEWIKAEREKQEAQQN